MLTLFKAIQYEYMPIYSFHKSLKNIALLKAKWKFKYSFLYPLFKHIVLLSEKIKGHQHSIFSSYCLAAVPARWLFRASEGMLPKKVVTLASTIFLLQWMDILPIQGICKEASLATRLHTNYPCQFCHNNFINQEEVIEHMEICSGTDPDPEVLKLIWPYGQKTFETYDKI